MSHDNTSFLKKQKSIRAVKKDKEKKKTTKCSCKTERKKEEIYTRIKL